MQLQITYQIPFHINYTMRSGNCSLARSFRWQQSTSTTADKCSVRLCWCVRRCVYTTKSLYRTFCARVFLPETVSLCWHDFACCVCVCLSLYLTFANAKFPTWYSSGSALPTRSHCSRDRNGTADSEDEMGTAERHKFFFEKPQNSFPIAGGATANCDPFGTKVGWRPTRRACSSLFQTPHALTLGSGPIGAGARQTEIQQQSQLSKSPRTRTLALPRALLSRDHKSTRSKSIPVRCAFTSAERATKQ